MSAAIFPGVSGPRTRIYVYTPLARACACTRGTVAPGLFPHGPSYSNVPTNVKAGFCFQRTLVFRRFRSTRKTNVLLVTSVILSPRKRYSEKLKSIPTLIKLLILLLK